MEISTRTVKNWSILDISGNIRRQTAPLFKSYCQDLIKKSKLRIIANFELVDTIDSVGLGILISVSKELTAVNGKFVLMALNENIHELLEMTSVDKMFPVLKSEEDLATFVC